LPGTPYCVPCLPRNLWIPPGRRLCRIADTWLLLSERSSGICQIAVPFSDECEVVFQEATEQACDDDPDLRDMRPERSLDRNSEENPPLSPACRWAEARLQGNRRIGRARLPPTSIRRLAQCQALIGRRRSGRMSVADAVGSKNWNGQEAGQFCRVGIAVVLAQNAVDTAKPKIGLLNDLTCPL
jgi:hypothetical protein